MRGLARGDEGYRETISRVHRRSAERLLRVFQTNRGVYIKAGQYLAALNHVLPVEFTSTFSVLNDQAPSSSWSDVEQLFREDFGGRHPDDVFDDFERKPIAAASLAQVHRAKTKAGRPVAVKLQYPFLARSVGADFATAEAIVRALEWYFPDGFSFGFILPEMRKVISRELDFTLEGRNADRTGANFGHDARIRVPEVLWDLTTSRVLTMEFVNGFKITDREAMERAGINVQQVSELLLEMYCEQIFRDGFVHADPHPGNLLVEPGPVLVLLDHGCVQELTDEFRNDYANLWVALFLRDVAGMKEYTRRLGLGDQYELFSILLTSKSMEASEVGLGRQMTREELKALRRKIHASIDELNELLANVPDQLYLILKANNIVRSINKQLGTDVNRFLYMAYYAHATASNTHRVASSVAFHVALAAAVALSPARVEAAVHALDFEF